MVDTSGYPAGLASQLLGAWRLESIQEAGGAVAHISDPTRVTADFRPDGRVHARAGYNQYNAVYKTDGRRLVLDTRSTLTTRGSPLQEIRYIALLDTERSWRSTVDDASLELRSDAGTLLFRR
jgi:heat shock protein HslJ